MTDKQHIEEIEELAALYSLGALPDEDAARFEQRVRSGCPLCCAELQESCKVVNALPFSATEVAPPPSLKARLMESIATTVPPKPQPKESEPLIVRPHDTKWKQIAPGVETRFLLGKKTMLVRMAPKSYAPEHDHPSAEQCLVLEGSVSNDGFTAYAGDFTYMPQGTHHTPLYSEDGCLLLIAYT